MQNDDNDYNNNRNNDICMNAILLLSYLLLTHCFVKDKSKIYTENELKSKLKKDLLLICQSLEIRSMTSQTKDTIINRIIKTQNDRFKPNPLCDYNKGSLEYSLPWPIISRILDVLILVAQSITHFWTNTNNQEWNVRCTHIAF
ncbi:hypothetical protein DFA_02704 [Cavenderia fasciculata]|uniref:Uncharacterized protein n=1 Tax=Cavenderia fasciculata TaxID=261658 RepID=F4Q050_CACFS|nr:uncharacterized protein DFA_02704 [Cavenderia fasciculata]EGG18964.1 hypothetical protein DFA_02704 [Cavenderia fasciculata]|eukprot:XP_004357426.1 hypothetical protein DFA_02704 [Cavenderia fasciculata]